MKKLIVCLLALCLILLLTACGGGKAKEVDLDALAAELAGSSAFTMDISGYALAQNIAEMTFSLDSGALKSCQYYYNNGSNEELLLAQTADEAAAETLEQACLNRVELQKSALVNYNPDAIPRLDNAVVVRSGSYVIYVVAEDGAAAKTIVDKYVK